MHEQSRQAAKAASKWREAQQTSDKKEMAEAMHLLQEGEEFSLGPRVPGGWSNPVQVENEADAVASEWNVNPHGNHSAQGP